MTLKIRKIDSEIPCKVLSCQLLIFTRNVRINTVTKKAVFVILTAAGRASVV